MVRRYAASVDRDPDPPREDRGGHDPFPDPRPFRRIQAAVRKTIVIVTHDIREAFALADRVGVLDAGELAAYDAPEALRESTRPTVRMLVDSMVGPLAR